MKIMKMQFFISDLDSDSGIYVEEKRIRREKIADETLFKASNTGFLVKTLGL